MRKDMASHDTRLLRQHHSKRSTVSQMRAEVATDDAIAGEKFKEICGAVQLGHVSIGYGIPHRCWSKGSEVRKDAEQHSNQCRGPGHYGRKYACMVSLGGRSGGDSFKSYI